MATIASLDILLGVDTGKLDTGLKKGSDKVENFAASLTSKLGSFNFAAIGAGVAAGAAVAAAAIVAATGAAAAGIASMTSAGMDRIDSLGDSAAELGVTTSALSELQYAAKLTGSSAEDMTAALGKMNQNLGDAALKATPTSDALERLGLKAEELSKLSPDQAFRRIVDGFGKIPGAAERASLAVDIFGKGGIKVLNTISAGGAELDRLAGEARRFGVSISQVDLAKVGAAKDALDRAGSAIEGVGNQLAVKLAPYVEVVANKFADWFAGMFSGGALIDSILDGVVYGIAGVIDAAERLRNVFAATSPGESAAQRLTRQYREFRAEVEMTAQSVAKAATANLSTGVTFDQMGKSVADLTAKLKDQLAAVGKTSAEAEIAKLKEKGATDEQLAGLRAISKEIAAKTSVEEKAKQHADEIKSFAKQAIEEAKTPAQKRADEMKKLNEAYRAGHIDESTFKKLNGKLKDYRGDAKLAGALELGSQEARSAVLAAQTGRSQNRVEENTRQIAANTGQTNRALEAVSRALENPQEIFKLG